MNLDQIRNISPQDAWAYIRKNAWQILGVALLTLFVHDVFGAHGVIAMRRTQSEIKQIRRQITILNDENKSMADEVNALKTDPKAIERIAREEMGLARPGELIYKLPDSTKPGDSTSPNSRK